jgi:hypothetical protein
MEQPSMCPDVVCVAHESPHVIENYLINLPYNFFRYQIMNDCWTYDSKKRPSFEKLVERFSELIKTDDPDLLKPMSQTYMTDNQTESTVKSRITDRQPENAHFNKGYVSSETSAKTKAE